MPRLIASQTSLFLARLAFDSLFTFFAGYGLSTVSVRTPHHVATLVDYVSQEKLLKMIVLLLSQEIFYLVIVYVCDSADAFEIIKDHLTINLTHNVLLKTFSTADTVIRAIDLDFASLWLPCIANDTLE